MKRLALTALHTARLALALKILGLPDPNLRVTEFFSSHLLTILLIEPLGMSMA
jgi:hypothetical protein